MRNPFKNLVNIKDIQKKVEAPSQKIAKEKQKALEISIKEGSATSFSSGLGDSYIAPFADALKANPLHFGIISSLAGLISPLAQSYGSRLMERKSRKKIVLTFVFLHAIAWLSLALIAFLAFKFPSTNQVYSLIILYTLLAIAAGLAMPAWFSWMGDLVPEKDRGKYFSKRNIASGLVGLAAVLIGAVILNAFKASKYLMIGFVMIFFLAFLFRMIALNFFKKQYSPKIKINRGDYFSFSSFLKRKDNFSRFAIYQAFFNFALMIASPFFAVYMLQDLGYNQNYVIYTLVSISSTVFYLIFTPLAGKFSDKYGNLKLLWIANLGFVLTPLLWIFSKNFLYIIFMPQLVAGLANAAFIIAFTNFTYDSVSPKNRGICLAYTNILIGIGTFVGSILGGLLLNFLTISFISKFFFVFILASFLRFIVALIFLPKLKEEKKVEKLPKHHLNILHPFKTVHSEINWFEKVFWKK